MGGAGDEVITKGGQIEFRLFGEVELRAAGQVLQVGTPRQQAVLAALIVDTGRPVAIETLVDRIWGDTPPVEARTVLYSHLSRIRRLLGQAADRTGQPAMRIERQHAGYVLDVDADLVDLHLFCRLVDRGRNPRCSDSDRAQSLDLWRGPPLAALSGQRVAQIRNRWHQYRLDAAVHWAQAELRLGHPTAVIRRLHDLVTEYPIMEPLEGLLMRALHAAGRDAEAIDRYTLVRQRLADDLGIDPGPELRTVHEAILRGELPRRPLPDSTVTAGQFLAPPAQLPPNLLGFIGRDHELHRLDDLITTGGDGAAAVVIFAVSGTAGIGKTALAVHWAHRVCAKFPDGQLYVNLRGFDPSGSPVKPGEVVGRFLDALEVPAQRIPAGVEAQVGLYRSMLAGRRVLVVLDNARDAEQVRPLLPGAPGCLVVVTSRNRLSGLVAEGAHSLTLDLLSAAEARELLVRRLGPGRVSTEPRAVGEIITLCARLPLALAIVAARAATHPGFRLASLAEELRNARGGLDIFAGTDPATDARAVFSWSYQQLSVAAARLFRLLGLHPGPDIATPAVASLAGLPSPQVRLLLAELAGACLIAEQIPGRYTFHDLLRAYAAEQAHITEPDTERRAAIRRMLGHYIHSGAAADRLLNPHRHDFPAPPLPPGVNPEHMADLAHALAWFDAEHSVLLAAVHHVAGFDAEIWYIAWTLHRHVSYQGQWYDSIAARGDTVIDVLIDAGIVALHVARRMADPVREAYVHRVLGAAYVRLDRYDDARAHLQAAIDLYQGAGGNVGEAYVHFYYSWMLRRQNHHQEALQHIHQALDLFRGAGDIGEADAHRHYSRMLQRHGRHQKALEHARQALDLFRAFGDRYGQAKVLTSIGQFHSLFGDHEEAVRYGQQALDLQEEIDDRYGQAETQKYLGYTHRHLGQHAQAITCYQAAIALYRTCHDRYKEADTLVSLGDTQHAASNTVSADAAWQHALTILDQLDHIEADNVRAKLNKLTDPNERRPPACTEL